MRNLNLPVFVYTCMQFGFLNRCFATHVEMTWRGFNVLLHPASVISNQPGCISNISNRTAPVISNRTKWVWEISIYLFSHLLAFSLDFSIVSSQLMSKWPGSGLMSYCILHLSFRTKLGLFLIFQIGQHLSFRTDLGVFLIFQIDQHLSFRIEPSEYEKSHFFNYPIELIRF